MYKVMVISGKGGVAKTTLANAIAHFFMKAGFRVGIIDADVDSPNLGDMLDMEKKSLEYTEGYRLLPATSEKGLLVFSMTNLINDVSKGITFSGEQTASFLNQSIKAVDWGELDYMIIDMPAGTGDELIQMSKVLKKNGDKLGAVVISPSGGVEIHDCERVIDVLQQYEIDIYGIIESKSDSPEIQVYGRGAGKEVAQRYEQTFLGHVPLIPRFNTLSYDEQLIKMDAENTLSWTVELIKRKNRLEKKGGWLK